MVGYSGTPLPKKLGIKQAHRLALVDAPVDFDATLGMDNTFDFVSTTLSPPMAGNAATPQFEGKFSQDYQSLTGKWFGTEAISGTWSATLTETNTLSSEPINGVYENIVVVGSVI